MLNFIKALFSGIKDKRAVMLSGHSLIYRRDTNTVVLEFERLKYGIGYRVWVFLGDQQVWDEPVGLKFTSEELVVARDEIGQALYANHGIEVEF